MFLQSVAAPNLLFGMVNHNYHEFVNNKFWGITYQEFLKLDVFLVLFLFLRKEIKILCRCVCMCACVRAGGQARPSFQHLKHLNEFSKFITDVASLLVSKMIYGNRSLKNIAISKLL
jgi:hypothetical protein